MKEFLDRTNSMIVGAAISYAVGYKLDFDNRIALVLIILLGFGLGRNIAKMLDDGRRGK